MKLKLSILFVLCALTANAQKVILTGDASTKAIGQPSGVLAGNNIQVYTGTRTNTSVARFDSSGNVKSSAMQIADDGSVTLTGTGTGGILFNDSDASNWTRIAAPSVVTTNGVYFLPVAPQTGYLYTTLSGTTNAQMAILNGVSKLMFLSSGGVPVTRSLGTGLSDDGTSINASGGGGGSGATNVLVNGVNITQANFKNNYAAKFNVSGSDITVTPADPVSATTAASTVVLDGSSSRMLKLTLTNSVTIQHITNAVANTEYLIQITQDATGGWTPTGNTNFFGFGDVITDFFVNTNATARSYIRVFMNSTSKADVLQVIPVNVY